MLRANRSALGLTGALLLLAGCAGGGSLTPAAAIPQLPGVRETSLGWLSDDAKGPSTKIYVSDYGASAVYIYDAMSPTKRIGTITNGISAPEGNFVDQAGTLYVANLNTSTVTVYPKGKTSPSATYSTGLSSPVDVVVGTDGTMYVSDFQANEVVEFDKGKTAPSRTLSINKPEGVTLDSKNNLYVCYFNPAIGDGGSGSVEEFKPKTITGTDLGTYVGTASDVKIDNANHIVVGDSLHQFIEFWKRGATTPYGYITVGAQPNKFALNSAETLVYVATFSTTVDIFYATPSGTFAGTISGFQQASGVSLSPPPPFAQ